MITVDEDFKRMRNKQNIYIYGAKTIANIVYNFLAENQCDVKGFMVSKTFDNPNCVNGLPVHLVYDMLDKKEKIYVVVAVLPRFRKEVVELLLQLGFCNMVTLSDIYANELKRRLNEKQNLSFLNNTEYVLEVPSGIEGNHAVLCRKDNIQSIKWRMDLGMLDYARQVAGTGAWQNDGVTAEYECIYGKSELLPRTSDGGCGFSGQGADEEIVNSANIYAVRCHVDKSIPRPIPYSFLHEIQAGAALTEQKICDLRDDTEDNISDKNRDFSECSAIYWIWKNGQKKEYTGIYHYRRYLDVSTEDLHRQMENGITLIHSLPCVMYPSNKFFFLLRFLYEYDWLLMMNCIKNAQPAYYETALQFEKGHFYLANNIFIMKTEWFDRMCEFVFSILLEIDKHYEDRGFERQDRYAGYLFEVLYSIFVMHHAKEIRIAYAEMIYLR